MAKRVNELSLKITMTAEGVKKGAKEASAAIDGLTKKTKAANAAQLTDQQKFDRDVESSIKRRIANMENAARKARVAEAASMQMFGTPAKTPNASIQSTMKNMFGESSEFGQAAKMLKGAGAFAGITIAASALNYTFKTLEESMIGVANGTKTMNEAMGDMVRKLPILGDVVGIFDSILFLATNQHGKLAEIARGQKQADRDVAFTSSMLGNKKEIAALERDNKMAGMTPLEKMIFTQAQEIKEANLKFPNIAKPELNRSFPKDAADYYLNGVKVETESEFEARKSESLKNWEWKNEQQSGERNRYINALHEQHDRELGDFYKIQADSYMSEINKDAEVSALSAEQKQEDMAKTRGDMSWGYARFQDQMRHAGSAFGNLWGNAKGAFSNYINRPPEVSTQSASFAAEGSLEARNLGVKLSMQGGQAGKSVQEQQLKVETEQKSLLQSMADGITIIAGYFKTTSKEPQLDLT